MKGDISSTTLGNRFNYIVEKLPESTAVIYDDKVITYNELNIKVNALCSSLLKYGITKNSRVGLLCERGPEWVAAMIAIVKIGAIYVPLSNDDPISHIEHLVSDVNVELILTDFDNTFSFVSTMNIKDINTETYDIVNYPSVISNSLAYIMFTSGTTGVPKGVGVTHDNILNLTVQTNYVRLDSDTRILQTGAPTFDASTFEVWGALLNGGGLIIPSKQGLTDFEYLREIIKKYDITTMWLTSPLFNIAAEQIPEMFEGLSELIVGGDVVNPTYVNKVLDSCQDIKIYNGYGPTECTTFSTIYQITPKNNGTSIPIGKPLKNVFVYILDENYNPVKQGEPGELYIGGKGVSNGYVNRPELNNKVFIDNPFGHGKLYKSGDMVSEDAYGNLHFLGRKDKQVKIRGYRIELPAIESMLENIDDIESAAVCVITNKVGSKEICSCVTVRNNKEIGQDEIRQKFSHIAPSYIVLSHIIIKESLPINKNGKIDYGKITELFKYKNSANNTISVESNSISNEARLIEIVKKCTGFDIHDISTSFFDLGIDSLMAVYLARDINNAFGIKINAVDILANPNILDLMVFLESSSNDDLGISLSNTISINRNTTSDKVKLTEIIEKYTGFDIHDTSTSFFDLGIDSLMAVYLARDINNAFGTKISAVDILANPNILDLMVLLESSPNNDLHVIKKRSLEKKLPILNQQKSLFVEFNLNPNSVRYNVPLLIKVEGEISIEKLTDALHKIVKRHDALRVQFSMSGTEVFQNIVDNADFKITHLEGSPDLKELIKPFNLLAELPFRFVIIEDKDCTWLFMDFHHIVVDGASLSVIINDLNNLYNGNEFTDININYATVVEKSNEEFQKNRNQCIDFWERYLRNYNGMSELPVDKQDELGISHKSNKFTFKINEERTATLRKWCQKNNITIFEGLLQVYACTLHAITSSSEVIFATPSREYLASSNEPIVAMLTNTLWVHSEVKKDESIRDSIDNFIRHLRESQKYQNVPINEIHQIIKDNNKETSDTFTDTLIAYHSVKDMYVELFGSTASVKPISPDEGMFSLNLQIFDCTTHLEADWEYLIDLFEHETIISLSEIFILMLDLLTQRLSLSNHSVSDLVVECIQKQMA
ncbi:amino acid adenylation domain-containing protein (plasmid) [Bacillus sp. PK9-021]